MKVLLGPIDEWRGAAPLLGKRGKLKSPLEAKGAAADRPKRSPAAALQHPGRDR